LREKTHSAGTLVELQPWFWNFLRAAGWGLSFGTVPNWFARADLVRAAIVPSGSNNKKIKGFVKVG